MSTIRNHGWKPYLMAQNLAPEQLEALLEQVKAMTGEIGMSRKQAVTELVEALDANNQEKPHG